jgi:ribosomal protein L29
MKRIATLREKSNDQLKERLMEIEISLRRGAGRNFAGASPNWQKPEDSMFMSKLKKEKARILTLFRERELKRPILP